MSPRWFSALCIVLWLRTPPPRTGTSVDMAAWYISGAILALMFWSAFRKEPDA